MICTPFFAASSIIETCLSIIACLIFARGLSAASWLLAWISPQRTIRDITILLLGFCGLLCFNLLDDVFGCIAELRARPRHGRIRDGSPDGRYRSRISELGAGQHGHEDYLSGSLHGGAEHLN